MKLDNVLKATLEEFCVEFLKKEVGEERNKFEAFEWYTVSSNTRKVVLEINLRHYFTLYFKTISFPYQITIFYRGGLSKEIKQIDSYSANLLEDEK